ncbi:unnamed protein product [Macrosiphum euphorbiae]|uniref:Uncharacterized protein n=1 Tax=Macrosiphum euphorbiae TaxID=13131 RepID=A0AAV0W6U4_9HEMI|nr:unnamed protein product [Macrosiphum euphorbiae]
MATGSFGTPVSVQVACRTSPALPIYLSRTCSSVSSANLRRPRYPHLCPGLESAAVVPQNPLRDRVRVWAPPILSENRTSLL